MEKYKDSDVELMSILLKLQEQTSPIRMSIGYTVGGTVRQGIILYEAAPKVIETLELVIYLAEDAATDGVDAQATKLIEDMMALTRGEMNTLYRDSIIQVLSTKIDNYRKTDILQPSDDMVLEQDKVIMAGDINVTVRNVVQSARGKE